MESVRDPDYEITKEAKEQLRVREETEKTQYVERIQAIIKREFQRELEIREKQLELIQRRITKTAKTLHLLRYCLVTSYYTKNEHQFNASETDPSLFDKQSRIHPAIKKLLGNNPLDIHTNLGLRKKRKSHKSGSNMVVQESSESTLKKGLSLEEIETTDNPVENASTEMIGNDVTVRNRKLYKHQIVIGNISKWAPSESPDDNSTHKWMVYVRGAKEQPDISHIVDKVVFYLHPSYKPNDVIEISKSPFHLSRRGWGEFPLRVQLYFHGKMNKPVDLIHNLKLDKTYTGRQTLGNETVIELSLYDLVRVNDANSIIATPIIKKEIIIEDVIQETFQINPLDETYLDHIDIKVEIEPTIVHCINLDHSYCQSDSSGKSKSKDAESKCNADGENGEVNDTVCNVPVKRRRPQTASRNVSKKIKMNSGIDM